MANIIYSQNMNLPIPVVGVQSGPNYALNVDACFAVLDAHDHTSGNGVQITPNALNINIDLPFNNNSLTEVESVQFGAVASLSALNSCYVIDEDLYFNDGLGNVVRITQSGSVTGASGTITGLPSGTASAAYVSGSGKFVFQSATNTGADMDIASLIIREKASAANGITISSPTSLAANYNLTLPAALPAGQRFATIDAAGAIAASWNVDNSTVEISSSNLQVKDLGITTAKIADGAVTPAKKAALGQQISSSCGAFSTTSGTYVDVTNLSVSITTTGRPVSILLQPDGSTNTDSSYIRSATEASNSGGLYIRILRDSTVISQTKLKGDVASTSLEWSPTSINFVDTPSAGTYTYKIQLRASGSGAVLITYSVLVAYEL